MEIAIKATFHRESSKERESLNIKITICIMAILEMDLKMGKDASKKLMEIDTKETGFKIKFTA